MSQDAYRKNSRRYLQQKGGQISNPHKNSKNAAQSPLRERKNQGNETVFPEQFITRHCTNETTLTCILLFVTNRQHCRAVWLQFRERAKEGGSGYPSSAQYGAHLRAL